MVEVGLGGRYDATNVADGAVAVITNVELDHTDILGASRLQIAAEKAGHRQGWRGGVLRRGRPGDRRAGRRPVP